MLTLTFAVSVDVLYIWRAAETYFMTHFVHAQCKAEWLWPLTFDLWTWNCITSFAYHGEYFHQLWTVYDFSFLNWKSVRNRDRYVTWLHDLDLRTFDLFPFNFTVEFLCNISVTFEGSTILWYDLLISNLQRYLGVPVTQWVEWPGATALPNSGKAKAKII